MEDYDIISDDVESTNSEQKQNDIKGFKRYLICLKKGYIIILILGIILSLTGLLISKFVYPDQTNIVFKYRYTENIDLNINDVISEENINRVKNVTVSWYTGSNISTYKYVECSPSDFKISKDGDIYTLYAKRDIFNLQDKEGNVSYNNTAAKGFLQHMAIMAIDEEKIEEYEAYTYESNGKTIKGISTIFDMDYSNNTNLDDNKMLNTEEDNFKLKMMIIYSVSGFAIGVLIGFIFIFIFKNKLDILIVRDYDNVKKYRTPFHKKFFTDSLKYFQDVKSVVMMSILLAFVMISKFIPIPSGFGELGISFGFLFLGIACMLYGPYPALAMGALSDIIGYLVRPNGPFMIGYTFQAMLACLFYALLLHKTYISFTRCFIARVLVNIVCNVIVGSICWATMNSFSFEAFITYTFTISLPKNLVYLLPQSLALYVILKAVSVPLCHANMVDSDIANNVSFF